MPENALKGNLNEFKDKIKEKWGKLADNDIDSLNGEADQLADTLQQRLGYAKEQATKAAQEFMNDFRGSSKGDNKDNGSKMRKSADQASEEITDLSKDLWGKTVEAAKQVKEEAGEYGKVAAEFIEHRPYQSIAIAGAAGLVLGLMLRRK